MRNVIIQKLLKDLKKKQSPSNSANPEANDNFGSFVIWVVAVLVLFALFLK